MSAVKLDPAPLNDLVPQALISIIGCRRSGKTTAAKKLVKYIGPNVGQIICFCTASVEWIDPNIRIRSKPIETLQEIMQEQDQKLTKARTTWQSSRNTGPFVVPKELRILLILDECVHTLEFRRSSVFNDICQNNKFYGLDIINIAQYHKAIPPEIRPKVDYVGVLYTLRGDQIFEEYVKESICSHAYWKKILKSFDRHISMCFIDNVHARLFRMTVEYDQ